MSDPELPDLKKKEKERKKAGAAWGWGKGASPFTGAAGGSGSAVARASASAAAQATAGAGQAASRSFLGQLLARLTSTIAGQLMLAGGLAVLIAGSGLLAHSLMFGSAAARPGGGPALGAIASSIRPHRPGASGALDALRRIAGGELKFEADKVEKPAEPATPAPPAQPEPQTAQDEPFKRPDHKTDRLAHNLSGAKLSGSLGGQFGGKNVFSSADAPKFGQGFDRSRISQLNAAPRGASKAMKGGVKARGIGQNRALRGSSKRAIGQLRMARTLSGQANQNGSSEQTSVLAGDAFDQRISQGGAPPTSPIDAPGATPTGGGGASVPPIGTGAPDLTAAPPVTSLNTTPYQNDLNRAFARAEQAGQMKKTSVLLMALGLALIAIGAALMATGFGAAIGAAIMAIGALLVGMSIMMLMMANMMAKQAREMGDAIQRLHGQQLQNERVHSCTDRAIGDGELPAECRQSDEATPEAETNVQRDAQAESNSTYNVEGGGPVAPSSTQEGNWAQPFGPSTPQQEGNWAQPVTP